MNREYLILSEHFFLFHVENYISSKALTQQALNEGKNGTQIESTEPRVFFLYVSEIILLKL